MRGRAPFQAQDLAELDESLLARANAVVTMAAVHDGHKDPNAIGLRHDLDGPKALEVAVRCAEWEADRGYAATFYVLHTAAYWDAPGFVDALDRIVELGHEVGLHVNCLAEALRTGRDPDVILDESLNTLRGYGFEIRGVAGHGDPFCNRDRAPGEITFANDEMFTQCQRPQEGEPDRVITRGNISLQLCPRPLEDFGLEYEALKVAYDGEDVWPFRISDSGGRWLNPGWEETIERWQGERLSFGSMTQPTKQIRQLHFLWHCGDWWAEAFVPDRVAA